MFALEPNPNYTFYNSDGNSDCANFISQALNYGGMKRRNLSPRGLPPPQPSAWYPYNSVWVRAREVYNFIKVFKSNSWTFDDAWAKDHNYTPSGHTTGDLVFYDWTGDDVIDHVAMMDSVHVDPGDKTFTGNVVNAHTSNRRYAQWHLRYYNAKKATTVYRLIAIRDDAS